MVTGGRGSFQSVKLQRPDRATVCSHSVKDATASMKSILLHVTFSETVKIDRLLRATRDPIDRRRHCSAACRCLLAIYSRRNANRSAFN